jgi:predicted transcriptional regulator
MNMMNKVDEIIEARKQILELPKDRMVSDIQAPSPFTTIPSRALSDKYILTHPSALQVLCVLCSYVNGVSGTAYPNQYSVAKRLNRSQPAVSRQFNNLIKWGYIEKIIKENPLRDRGRKGATWRVIYDPEITADDIAMTTTDPRVEENKAQDTMKEVVKEQVKEEKKQARLSEAQLKLAESITQRYLKDETEYFAYGSVFDAVSKYLSGEQTIEAWNSIGIGLLSPIEKGYLKPNKKQPLGVVKHINSNHKKQPLEVVQQVQISQPQEVVHNSNNITINNSIIENGKEMTERYAHMLDEIMGTRGSWRWDMRQEAMAEEIARMGITVDQFSKTVTRVLKHKRKEGIQPPYTLSYFKSVFTENKQPGNVKDLTKKLARSFKL